MHAYTLVLGLLLWSIVCVALGVLLSKRVITTMSDFYSELHHRERESFMRAYAAEQRAKDLVLKLESKAKDVVQEAKDDAKKIISSL
jgi:hypothetical protein